MDKSDKGREKLHYFCHAALIIRDAVVLIYECGPKRLR